VTVIFFNPETTALVPVLGLFAAAVFRIIPAVNRLGYHAQSVQFFAASLNALYTEIIATAPLNTDAITPAETAPPPRATFPAAPPEIQVQDVTFTYPRGVQPVLQKINFTIPAGEAVGFIGESGAGKSTLLAIVLGLLPPTQGKVSFVTPELAAPPRAWRGQIGYVPQAIYLTDDSLRRNIALGEADENIDALRLKNAVTAAKLDRLLATLPAGLDTVVGENGARLSGGERQRVGIARALYRAPQVLILDEATSALDDETENAIAEVLQNLRGQITSLTVAHRPATVARCTRIYRLQNGTLTGAGTPAEMLP
jgi:ABC-type multidrug transport system fused ATPase/permease subunit